jgi:predicted nucleic acid-binding protein
MTTVFLDTVGLISIWDTASQWHAAASSAYERLLRIGAQLTTTSFVLLECGNAAARQPFLRDVNELRKQLDAAQQLVYPSERDWEMAWFAFERGEAGDAGIVDQVSFVVMRRLESPTHSRTIDTSKRRGSLRSSETNTLF